MFTSHVDDDFNMSQESESVEVNAASVLPLHARDELRSPASPIHRSSSYDSLPGSRRSSGFGSGMMKEEPELVPVESPHHSLPHPDQATGDLEVNTNKPVAVAEFKNEGGEEESYHHNLRPRRRRCIMAILCLLLVTGAVLIGVFVGTKDNSPNSEIEENQAIIDKDDPNNIPPSPTPLPDDDEYTTNDNPYGGNMDNDGDGAGIDPNDQRPKCPVMSIPGNMISNFEDSIRLSGRIDNTTVIGANNNPNATSDAVRLLPSCQDNSLYGRGLWWIVKGPGAVVRASTCQSMGLLWDDSSSSVGGLPLDTQLSVFTSLTSTCSDGLECVTGNDDASCGTQSTVSWYAEQDRLYYMFVSLKPSDVPDRKSVV